MYIVLDNRPDRMGSNLTWYIMQIIYAHKNKWFVHYQSSPFNESIYFKSIKTFVNKYNYELGEELGSHDHKWQSYIIDINEQDWPGNNMKVCNNIKQDLISYYYEHLYESMNACLNSVIVDDLKRFNNMPDIDLKKTIAVHLRLDDVVDRMYYDGIHSTEYYRNKIDTENIGINLIDEKLFFLKRDIDIPGPGRHYNPYDCQAPIEPSKLQKYIDDVQKIYPEHEVIIVTSPISKVDLPYRVIQNRDPDLDIFIMSKADVLITSKSLFCFSAMYFGNPDQKRFIPMWGHIAGTGLTSKHDKTTNNTYLY